MGNVFQWARGGFKDRGLLRNPPAIRGPATREVIPPGSFHLKTSPDNFGGGGSDNFGWTETPDTFPRDNFLTEHLQGTAGDNFCRRGPLENTPDNFPEGGG